MMNPTIVLFAFRVNMTQCSKHCITTLTQINVKPKPSRDNIGCLNEYSI